jgi:hypothetical protein
VGIQTEDQAQEDKDWSPKHRLPLDHVPDDDLATPLLNVQHKDSEVTACNMKEMTSGVMNGMRGQNLCAFQPAWNTTASARRDPYSLHGDEIVDRYIDLRADAELLPADMCNKQLYA